MQKNLLKETRHGQLLTLNDRPKFICHSLEQIHSDTFVDINDLNTYTSPPQGDGFLSTGQQVPKAFALKTADCIPLLLEGNKGWALAHLGWKGLQLEMIRTQRIKELEITHAWIGPHICSSCYEVKGEGHLNDFTKNFPLSDNFRHVKDKLYFSLQDELIQQIKMINPTCEISCAPFCTFTEPWLHSYRRNGTKKRNWTIFLSKN